MAGGVVTTATRTRSRTGPRRGKALGYFRDFRLRIHTAAGIDGCRPELVLAKVMPADGDPSGWSTEVNVRCVDGMWTCSGKGCGEACGHRLVVQMATGWGELDGGSGEDVQWPDGGPF